MVFNFNTYFFLLRISMVIEEESGKTIIATLLSIYLSRLKKTAFDNGL
jgi:hypothetical protein